MLFNEHNKFTFKQSLNEVHTSNEDIDNRHDIKLMKKSHRRVIVLQQVCVFMLYGGCIIRPVFFLARV